MKLLVKNQHKVGTAQKQKNIKYKRMNKRMLELEAENEKLRKKIKSSHKCEGCRELIYYQSYCEKCKKSWES